MKQRLFSMCHAIRGLSAVWRCSNGVTDAKKPLFHTIYNHAIRMQLLFKLTLIYCSIYQWLLALSICFSWARTKQGSVLLHQLGMASPGQREVHASWHRQTALYTHCVRFCCPWPGNSASEAARRVDWLRQRYNVCWFKHQQVFELHNRSTFYWRFNSK